MKYVGIVGTNADFSYNRLLLKYMKKHFIDKADIDICEINDIPAFDEDVDVHDQPKVMAFAKKIEDADGVIIATPEYDHSIPAALKSVIEWFSYQIKPLKHKAIMIVGTSYGPQGSARAQLQLRQILAAPDVDADAMPGSEFLLGMAAQSLTKDGNLTDTNAAQELDVCFDDFLRFTNGVLAYDHKN